MWQTYRITKILPRGYFDPLSTDVEMHTIETIPKSMGNDRAY